MSDFGGARSPYSVSARKPRTWDFMETLFVVLLADGAFTLTGGLTFLVILAMHGGAQSLSADQLQSLSLRGDWWGVAVIVGSPPAIAVLWVAVRMAGRDFVDYLALNWPSGREIARAFVITAILLVIEIVTFVYTGGGSGAAADYLAVKDSGGLFVLLVSGCIVGPMMEEFVVRGFMFRGWSESFLGPRGTILLTSVLWALNHTQYGWSGRFWIFVTGVALGHFRWRSNSTWLTVIIHSAINTLFFFLAPPFA